MAYQFDTRWALCGSCYRPVSVPVAGGTASCPGCGAQMAVPQRRLEPLGRGQGGLSADQRLQVLTAQDGRPLEPPQDLGHLFEGGMIPKWKLREALALWVSLGQSLASGADPTGAEKYFILTLVLGNHQELDHQVRRAVLESSLDILTLPRHRQVVLAQLSAGASLEGDTRSALAWLGPCDQESSDLQADSAWRIAEAMVASVQGDSQRVLQLLEPAGRVWPIHDSMDARAVLLRVDAHERLGQVEQAVAILENFVETAGFGGRAVLEKMANEDSGHTWAPEALKRYREQERAKAAAGAGWYNRFLGGVLMAAGIFIIAVMMILTYIERKQVARQLKDDRASGEPEWVIRLHKRDLRTIYLLDGLFGIVAIGLIVGGSVVRAKAKKERRIVEHGIPVQATIQSVEMTATRVNYVPVYRLNLVYRTPDGTQHSATVSEPMDPARAANLQGAVIGVWVDPKDPDHAVMV